MVEKELSNNFQNQSENPEQNLQTAEQPRPQEQLLPHGVVYHRHLPTIQQLPSRKEVAQEAHPIIFKPHPLVTPKQRANPPKSIIVINKQAVQERPTGLPTRPIPQLRRHLPPADN